MSAKVLSVFLLSTIVSVHAGNHHLNNAAQEKKEEEEMRAIIEELERTQYSSHGNSWEYCDGEQIYDSTHHYFALANKYYEEHEIQKALNEYQERLSDPAILICTKAEIEEASNRYNRCKKALENVEK